MSSTHAEARPAAPAPAHSAIIDRAWAEGRQRLVTPTQWLVFEAAARRAVRGAIISTPGVAADTNTSYTTASRSLRSLAECGMLRVVSLNTSHTSAVYALPE